MSWPTTSSSSRGYGAPWRKRRERILKRDKYLCTCEECAKREVPLSANEVNHRIPKAQCKILGWTDEQIDDDSNLHSLNDVCHKRITREQLGHTYREPRRIGLDGFPLEA